MKKEMPYVVYMRFSTQKRAKMLEAVMLHERVKRKKIIEEDEKLSVQLKI